MKYACPQHSIVLVQAVQGRKFTWKRNWLTGRPGLMLAWL